MKIYHNLEAMRWLLQKSDRILIFISAGVIMRYHRASGSRFEETSEVFNTGGTSWCSSGMESFLFKPCEAGEYFQTRDKDTESKESFLTDEMPCKAPIWLDKHSPAQTAQLMHLSWLWHEIDARLRKLEAEK